MSYNKQLQQIANDFMKEGSHGATAREIAGWAIKERRWEPQPAKVLDLCAGEIARAMREEYFTDRQGRRVRAKHVAIVKKKGKQIALGKVRHDYGMDKPVTEVPLRKGKP